MRTLLVVAGIAPLMLLCQVERASAQNYPWCAQYGGNHGGRNCGFSTLEQCRAAISGNGGYCDANPLYRPAENPPHGHRPDR